MGLTVTEINISPIGEVLKIDAMSGADLNIIALSVAFDNSYLTGGEILDLSPYVRAESSIISVYVPEDTNGYVCKYVEGSSRDESLGKLKLYLESGNAGVLAEVGSAVDVSALSAVRVIVLAT